MNALGRARLVNGGLAVLALVLLIVVAVTSRAPSRAELELRERHVLTVFPEDELEQVVVTRGDERVVIERAAPGHEEPPRGDEPLGIASDWRHALHGAGRGRRVLGEEDARPGTGREPERGVRRAEVRIPALRRAGGAGAIHDSAGQHLDGARGGQRRWQVRREFGGQEAADEEPDRGARAGARPRARAGLPTDQEEPCRQALDASVVRDVGRERAGSAGGGAGSAGFEGAVGGGPPAGQGRARGGFRAGAGAGRVQEGGGDAPLLRADEEQAGAERAEGQEHEQREQEAEPAGIRPRDEAAAGRCRRPGRRPPSRGSGVAAGPRGAGSRGTAAPQRP